MLGSFCTIYTLYDFLKVINYLKKCWIDRNAFFHSLGGFTFCVSRRMPRGRGRSAAGAHRPAKPVGEAIGDGYRRLRAVCISLLRCRTYGVVKTIFPKFTGSEWCHTYCGIILPLSYDLRWQKQKSTASGEFFLRSGAFLVSLFWMLQKLLHRYGILTLCQHEKR